VPCDAEAWRVPSMSLCYIFRKSKGSDELCVAATGPVQTRPKQRKNALSAMRWISVPFSQTKVRSASAVALSTDRSWPVCDCVSCVCVRVRQSVFAVLSASRVASRVGGAVRSRAVRSRSG
jgi:hypothetical protein